MKGNAVSKVFCKLRTAKNKVRDRLKNGLEGLSPRQRVTLVGVLFFAFVVIDVIYIINGFKGSKTPEIEIQHIRQVDLLENPNTNEDDTISE